MQQRAQKRAQTLPPNWGLAHRLRRPRPLGLLRAWRCLLGGWPCCSPVRPLFLACEKQLLLARLQAGQEVLLASALLARAARAVLWGTVWRWMRCRRGQAGGCWPQGFRPAPLHRLLPGGHPLLSGAAPRVGGWGAREALLPHGLVLAMQGGRQHPWVLLPYPLRALLALALLLMSPLMSLWMFLLAFHLLPQQGKREATAVADQAVAFWFCLAPAAKPETVRHLFHSCRGAARCCRLARQQVGKLPPG